MPYKKLLTLTVGGLMSLSLLGCSTPSAPQVSYIKEYPPAALLLPCPKPSVQVLTNGDLVTLSLELWQALDACNDDKEALRDWAVKEPNGRKLP